MIGTWIVLIASTVIFLVLGVIKPGKSIFDK